MGTETATLGQVLDIVYGLSADDFAMASSADFMDSQRLGVAHTRSEVRKTFGSVAHLASVGIPSQRIVNIVGVAPHDFPMYEGKSHDEVVEDVERIAKKIHKNGYVAQSHYFVNKTASDLDVVDSLPSNFPERVRVVLSALVAKTYTLGAEIVKRANKRKMRSVGLGEALAALSYVASKVRATAKASIPLSTRELALAVGLSHPTAIKLRRVLFGVLGRRKRPQKGVQRLLRKCYADELVVESKKILDMDKVRADLVGGGWGTLFTRGVFSSRNPMWRSGKKHARLEDRALILATHDDPALSFTEGDFARKAIELGASSSGAYRAAHRCMDVLNALGITEENMHKFLSGDMCVNTSSPAVMQYMMAGDKWVAKSVERYRLERNTWRGFSKKEGMWQKDEELRPEENWMTSCVANYYRRRAWKKRGLEYKQQMKILRSAQDHHESLVFRELIRVTGVKKPRFSKAGGTALWRYVMTNRNTTLKKLARCYIALRDERRSNGDYELGTVSRDVNAALALYTLTSTARRAHYLRAETGAWKIAVPDGDSMNIVDICYGELSRKVSPYVEKLSHPLGGIKVRRVPPCPGVSVTREKGRPALSL